MQVLRRWEQVLAGLERDPMELADQLDWVAKFRLLEGYRERHGLRGATPSSGDGHPVHRHAS